jgi:membrane fusion protein, multidrug efflux system
MPIRLSGSHYKANPSSPPVEQILIPPENATGNFTKIVQRVPVRVVLDASDAQLPMLRPGLSTTVDVDTRLAKHDQR